MIGAVLFDLDNTLIERDRAFRACVAGRFHSPGVQQHLWKVDEGGHGDRAALLQAWKKYSGENIGLTELGCAIAAELSPDPALLETLRELSGLLPLGLVTNGGTEAQRSKIRSAGLDTAFAPERCWVSGEVGCAKPHPEIFLRAARGLGVAPGNCLMVGDYAPHDEAGAFAAGMRSHLVNQPLDAHQLRLLMEKEGVR